MKIILTFILTLIYALDKDTFKFVYCPLKILWSLKFRPRVAELQPTGQIQLFLLESFMETEPCLPAYVLSMAASEQQQQSEQL